MTRPTLRGLARELGLSVGTVSRALNGYADISDATRARVREAADRVGYDPDPIARRLATGSTETIAYLMPASGGSLAYTFMAELLDGLSDALAAHGWDLLLIRDPSVGGSLDALQRLARSRRVSAIVLSRPHRRDARVDVLRRAGLPFVVHGRTADCEDYAWFDVDGHRAMMDAVDHLVGLGHGRIGYVGGPSHYNFAVERLAGFKAGLSANGIAPDDELIRAAELSDIGGEGSAADLLDAPEPPTALICVSDHVALGALAAARARGIAVGSDLSIIGYDGLEAGRHAAPALTTMAQPQADAGRRIGEMALALARGDDPRQHQVLRRAALLQRDTDGPAPGRTAYERGQLAASSDAGRTA
ncbi:MAG: LacI family DNA-binding transcriptional regulator [Pseudomonadota bacterium]